jgi:hypothetical protein
MMRMMFFHICLFSPPSPNAQTGKNAVQKSACAQAKAEEEQQEHTSECTNHNARNRTTAQAAVIRSVDPQRWRPIGSNGRLEGLSCCRSFSNGARVCRSYGSRGGASICCPDRGGSCQNTLLVGATDFRSTAAFAAALTLTEITSTTPARARRSSDPATPYRCACLDIGLSNNPGGAVRFPGATSTP